MEAVVVDMAEDAAVDTAVDTAVDVGVAGTAAVDMAARADMVAARADTAAARVDMVAAEVRNNFFLLFWDVLSVSDPCHLDTDRKH